MDDRHEAGCLPWAVRLNLQAVRTHSFLVVNPRSGSGSPSAEELATAARERGIEPYFLASGEDPGAAARRADAEILGAAGGDGSLAPVAAAALESGASFVCVPFGTRNHFARDVGLDRDDPLGALEAFTDGVERRIDVGRVNGRPFLNNLSLGAYAGLVHRRERHRRRGEALARARALLQVAHRRHRLHASVDGAALEARVLLVGNNRYDLDLFTLGSRERLDEGVLQLWAAAGWLPTNWEEQTAARFRIEVPRPQVRAAVDGEPVVLESPLELESLPGELRLLVPSRIGGAVHDNPEATEGEQEQAQEGRQQEEESMRYPEHDDPDEQRKRALEDE
jgi:diacylglycerol kinase family enzyme